jgi:chromate transporter
MTEGEREDSGMIRRSAALGELAAVFLRLGVTAFGGPAVHVPMMENEVVRRRQWMSSERFVDLFGVSAFARGR